MKKRREFGFFNLPDWGFKETLGNMVYVALTLGVIAVLTALAVFVERAF